MDTSHDAAITRPIHPGQAPSGAREAIREYVLEHISRGEWTVGQRLPTDEQLAEQFSVSRTTVNQAMKVLEREGFLRRFRRRGTFIATAPVAAAHEALNKINPPPGRAHIVAPLSPAHASMHWNRGTLDQLEAVLNASSLQVAHHSMSDTPPPAEFRRFIESLTLARSRALVILLDLEPKRAASLDGETALIPYIHALRDYPGRVCWLNRAGVPLSGWPHDAISFSPMGEGMLVEKYLQDQGVSQVISLVRLDVFWSRMRYVGMDLASRESSRPMQIDTRFFLPGDLGEEQTESVFHRLLDELSQRTDRPTVITPNDIYAAALLDLARKRNIPCPEKFCLIGFGNDERYRQYNITTVAPPAGQVGEVIGQLICDQVRRPSNAAIHMALKSVIIERSTFITST